jgi:hypothetical protein
MFDKALLLIGESIGGLFLPVKGYSDRYLDRKAGADDAISKRRWSSGRFSEKSDSQSVMPE